MNTAPRLSPDALPALQAPRISVLVCNYNYARYVGAALESVLAQTEPAHEIIVVDDGSTDASVAVVQRYADRGVRLVQQANGGQLAAYNAALPLARGEVVLFLDSDDLLLPGALAAVGRAFAAGVAKVHFRLELVGSDGRPLGGVIPSALAEGDVAQDLLRHGVPHASPPASGNAYRRSVLQRLFPLPLDPGDRHAADFFCIHGSALLGSVAACAQPLGQYRVHRTADAGAADGLTFGNAEKGHVLADRMQRRMARFSSWIEERSGGGLQPPTRLLDFSLEKTAYASAALFGAGGRGSRRAASRQLPAVLRSIWRRPATGPAQKLGLVAWAALVLLAPRPLALRAARFVCDPASRGRAAGLAS